MKLLEHEAREFHAEKNANCQALKSIAKQITFSRSLSAKHLVMMSKFREPDHPAALLSVQFYPLHYRNAFLYLLCVLFIDFI